MRTKIFTILIVFFLLFTIKKADSQFVYAYVGNDTLRTNYPFATYWEDGRTDMLYLTSEITAAGGVSGVIMQIGFNVVSADTLTMNGFFVKMLHTTQTTISAFFSGSWDIAYSGTYKVNSTGWQYINLTTPFGWNGVDNLLIEVCYNNARWTQYSPVRATTSTGKTVSQYTDLPTGDGCMDFNAGTVQAIRPNICLVLSPYTGVNNHTSGIPGKYSLSQNYPNPFNPVTKIEYSIPKAGFVTLKVYDLLGREISTLVNEIKKAGYYMVDFNAMNLSSGTYYYKLVANDFSEMKKMTVIK
jgi:hypothetical protein